MDLTSQRLMMGSASREPTIPMILTFDTSLGEGTTVTLPLSGEIDIAVNWGDGFSSALRYNGPIQYQRTYATDGVYTVTIFGYLDQFGLGSGVYSNAEKLVSVQQFGLGLKSLSGAFRGASNLTSVPTSIPKTVTNLSYCFKSSNNFNSPNVTSWDTSNVTTMQEMFFGCSSFNQNISGWNTSKVTDFRSMFRSCSSFNQPIGSWNTSGATNMSSMFNGASSFNNPINNWDVSKVTNMSFMFAGTRFTQPLNNWNVSSVTNMSYMFWNCPLFNQNINSWNVSNVTTMESMFKGCFVFNQPLNNWNVSNVTDMSRMFADATNFNQNINSWDTSKVTNMQAMFYAEDVNGNPHKFNQPLIGWNTSSVTNMPLMFRGARSFNQEIGSWDVSKVVNMSGMFAGATAFNRNIGNWDVSSVTNMNYMFEFASAFNQDLSKWCVSNFSTQPEGFDLNANIAWIAKPVWGTCPLDTYNFVAFFDPDTLYPNDTGFLPNLAKLKWTGQNIQNSVSYQFFNANGTAAGIIDSSTTGESRFSISVLPTDREYSWLAGRATATSTIDGSQVVAYARINVIQP